MANVILKTNSIPRLIGLNNSQMDVLLSICYIAKYNAIDMNDKIYEEITILTGLSKKSIQNNLRELVKAEILIKSGTLSSYVIDPTVFSSGNYEKCVARYNAAASSELEYNKIQAESRKNARGDFESRKLEAEFEERRSNLS